MKTWCPLAAFNPECFNLRLNVSLNVSLLYYKINKQEKARNKWKWNTFPKCLFVDLVLCVDEI